MNQILSDNVFRLHHHMLPAHVLKYHALRLGHLFTSWSPKKAPKIGWTKLKKKDILARKIHQLNIFDSKNPIQHPPFQHQPVQVSVSEPTEICFGAEPVVFFKRCGPPGPTRDFCQKKLQDLWPDKIVWRSFESCFFGVNGLWMWIQKIVKKKWIHEYMKEKSKVQTSCLFKNNHFSQYPGRIQGSKRLVDGIRCGLFVLCCSPFYVVHLFILREASFPIKNEQKSWSYFFSTRILCDKSPPYLFYPNDFFCCKCAWHLWCRLNRRHFICRMLKHEKWKSTMAQNRPSQNVSKIELQILAGSCFLLISPSTWNESVVLRHKLSSFCWTFVRLSDAEGKQLYYYRPWKFQRMDY